MSKSIFSDVEKQLVAKEYSDGQSLRSLASKYECDRNVIRCAVNKSGVILRTPHEACTKRKVNERYFDVIDTEKKAYFLGLIYADGCIKDNPKAISVGLQDCDAYILSEFKKDIDSEHKIGRYVSSGYWCNYLSIGNPIVVDSLMRIGCMPRKSFTCDIPTAVPGYLMSHFVRGYFDGDGHVGNYTVRYKHKNTDTVSEYKRTNVAICASEAFAKSLAIILQSNDISSTITKDKSIKRVRIIKSSISKFASYLYQDASVFMSRKRIKFVEGGVL